MSRIRTLFLGTPDFAAHCLKGLAKDEHFEIVGVMSQPDRPAGRKMKLRASEVKKCAEELGFPVLTPDRASSPESLKEVASLKAEVAVVVAYGQILSREFLALFPDKVVNIHGSLLPHLRGAAPIQRSIMNGETETGVSLQVMVYELDAGAILGTRPLKIGSETTALELLEQMKSLASDLLATDLMDYLRGNLTPIEQDPDCVTLAPKLSKEESAIDWSLSAEEIFNRQRGLLMGPGSYAFLEGKKMKFLRLRLGRDERGGAPGEVTLIGDDFFRVSTGSGCLEVLEVQPESKPKMKASEFLRGASLKAGDRFN